MERRPFGADTTSVDSRAERARVARNLDRRAERDRTVHGARVGMPLPLARHRAAMLRRKNGWPVNRLERRRAAYALGGREIRTVTARDLEVRELSDDVWWMHGVASATERAYEVGFYVETIARGAFVQTLSQRPDVLLLENHQGLPLARTVSGTLRLAETDDGLEWDADVNARSARVQEMRMAIERGDVTECSFAFSGAKSEWDEDYTQRRITSLSLHRGDVSVVSLGANPATSVTMRSRIARARPSLDTFRARGYVLGARGRGYSAGGRRWRRPNATTSPRSSQSWRRVTTIELSAR
jgi:HK97 family phage prohead protease